jgi:hypothetical protein
MLNYYLESDLDEIDKFKASVNWESSEKRQQKLAAMRAAVQVFVLDGSLQYLGE